MAQIAKTTKTKSGAVVAEHRRSERTSASASSTTISMPDLQRTPGGSCRWEEAFLWGAQRTSKAEGHDENKKLGRKRLTRPQLN